MPVRFALLALFLSAAAARPVCSATLVYSNDVLGEIEPCGCRSNPLGGMSRRAKLQEGKKDLLQLDAGDLLFSSDSIPEPLANQSRLQAEWLLKALDRMGHDAVVPGEKDFALGVKAFEKLLSRTKVRFLAANLHKRRGGGFLEGSALFTRKDQNGKSLRIAVLGLVGETLAWPRELKAEPALGVARAEIPKLRKKADLVIALTHQGLEADRKLAEGVPGIDIIVGGHTQSFLQEPLKVGSTLIYQSSFRNQYVGMVPLTQAFTGEGHQLVGLDAGYDTPGGPEAKDPTEMEKLVRDFKAAIASLNEKEAASRPVTRVTSAKFHTFPKCAECHVRQFDFWRKTAHANALAPLMEKEQFRNKECLGCHTVGLGDPEGFSDVTRLAERRAGDVGAKGFAPSVAIEDLAHYLKAMHEAPDLTTPVKLARSDAAPLPLRDSLNGLARSWTPVQCENCHQPGWDHPFTGQYSKSVATESCLKCHTPDRAPEWYSQGKLKPDLVLKKRAQITCPAGDLPETD